MIIVVVVLAGVVIVSIINVLWTISKGYIVLWA
jgi:hypothetical protein